MITATLYDCHGVSDYDADLLAEIYINSLLARFGTSQQIMYAFEAYQGVFNKYESYPLPADSEVHERIVVNTWAEAEAAAHREAFKDWNQMPAAAHFELNY